jgi:sucrose synthase
MKGDIMIPHHVADTQNVIQNSFPPVELIKPEFVPLAKRFHLHLKGSTHQAFFLADEITRYLEEFLSTDTGFDHDAAEALRRLYRGCQEMLIYAEYTYALLRQKIGTKRIVRLHPQLEKFEQVNRFHYLEIKDAFVQGPEIASKKGLVLNFTPFFLNFPKVKEPGEMGKGISFLNRHLSGQMYQNSTLFGQALLRFLRNHRLTGMNLLVNDYLSTPEMLLEELEEVRMMLENHDSATPYTQIAHELRIHGFEPGWGRNAGEIGHRLGRLARLLESPDPVRFEMLLSRLPLFQKVLMVSPHGWFAQEGVLGKPDTGGQVTYVLDQACMLEREMGKHFATCGLKISPQVLILTRLIPHAEDTTCNVPREKIYGTENSYIIRVPFRDASGNMMPDWISRFHIWPYLETFAEEAKNVVISEFQGYPDLIVGHYSDGNLVAYLLADVLGTTHCAAVHALEKTKYLFSDLRWAEFEQDYHFSLQFTADIIAYNSADFIISSSYREIGGTATEMGMFESYETFTMPGLYRVLSGMDPQLARYNIVPPGANEAFFFPYTETERREEGVIQNLTNSLFSRDPGTDAFGHLENPDLPPIFAMARVDKIKNISGLVEIFGKSPNLQNVSNLVIVSFTIDANLSQDQEEIEEIQRMYSLIQEYQLDGHIRWRGVCLNKFEKGEVYRIMADRKGVFAQPALMETFGLTIVEAMISGLPVVVTCYGGPSEIVIPEKSGLINNPNDHEGFAQCLERVVTQPDFWETLSKGGIKRVNNAFTWSNHAKSVLRLANIYAYWNYLDVMNRQALDQYIHTLYHTIFRPRSQQMLS